MAQANEIVNKFGKMQGWNCITINFLGRDVEAVGKIAYDDTVPKENVYGKGKYPIGRKEGNYAGTFKLSLYKEEADAIDLSMPPGMRWQDIAAFPVVVDYETNSGVILTDVINDAEFQDRGVEVAQGDGSIMREYDMIISTIDWNVNR